MLGNLSYFCFCQLTFFRNSSTKVWDRAWIELATPGTAVRHASVVRHAALSTALRGPVCLSVNHFGSRSALTHIQTVRKCYQHMQNIPVVKEKVK